MSTNLPYPLILLSDSGPDEAAQPDCLLPLMALSVWDFSGFVGVPLGFFSIEVVGFGNFCAFVVDSSRFVR